MKISVVVPSYNYSLYLDECLRSIKQQNYHNYEVLIADGGSTDGSVKIINKYCEDDDRFRFVSDSDNGQSEAIKKAFDIAEGEIYCFLNSDDCYICNNAFDLVVNAFRNYQGIDIVSFGGYYIDTNSRYIKKVNYRYHPLDGFHLMRYRTAILQPATFWKKEVYKSNYWPTKYKYVFDVVFFYSIYLEYSWLELTRPIAGYRIHTNNKSISVRSERIKELAEFEQIKFGKYSFRAFYLLIIAHIISILEKFGKFGSVISKLIYYLVNSIAFITCYRLPNI